MDTYNQLTGTPSPPMAGTYPGDPSMLASATTTGSSLIDPVSSAAQAAAFALNGGLAGATLPTDAQTIGVNGVPPLSVRVEGLTFQYQFTEDDVRKVFSRYGDVHTVYVAHDGAAATVCFSNYSHAMQAWNDLNGKQLAGINGANLNVDCPSMSSQGEALIISESE